MDGITPFNLEKENEEGKICSWSLTVLGTFDGNGFYTWKKDRDEVLLESDPFLRDLDKNGLAVIPKKSKEEEQKEKEKKEEKEFSQNMQLVRLCACLQDEETPMLAMNRLSPKPEKKEKKARHRLAFERVEEKELTPAEKEFNKKMIDVISDACSVLIEEFLNIYDMKKEEIKRLVVVGLRASCDVDQLRHQREAMGVQVAGAAGREQGRIGGLWRVQHRADGGVARNGLLRVQPADPPGGGDEEGGGGNVHRSGLRRRV